MHDVPSPGGPAVARRRRPHPGLILLACALLVTVACDAEIQAILDAELQSNGLPPGDVGVVQALCVMIHGVAWMTAKKLGLPNAIDDCADRWFGNGNRADATLVAGRAGTTANGLTVMEQFAIDSTTRAGKLPKWKATVPAWPGDSSDLTASVAVILTAETFGNPDKTPRKFVATLFDVKPNGKRRKVKRRVGKISNSSGGVAFDGLGPPTGHYQFELKMRGGKALPGSLFYMAGIAGADATGSSPVDTVRPRLLVAGPAAGATSESLTIFDAHTVVGKVKAKALPQWTARLFSTNTSPSGPARSVAAGLLAFDPGYQPNASAPKALLVRLFDVNANGARTQIASRRVPFDAGLALAEFDGLSAPADHFEVDVEAVGGRGSTGFLTFMASESAEGGAQVPLPLRMARERTALLETVRGIPGVR